MLFNSFEFIFIFLPISFFIYFYLNKKRLTELSKSFLLISSLFFYSYWNTIYLPLILFSMTFNFSIGKHLAKMRENKRFISKKVILTIGIVSNVSLLVYFKYSDFFIGNFNLAVGSNFDLLHLALPLAISFYTFQQIAYLVDSYKGETKEYDFLSYAVFVTFFPQLIAGPIVHHSEMMPQFSKPKNNVINYTNISIGLFIFSIGLFKKVVIADSFAVWANEGFDISTELSLFEAWVTSLSYTFQLYFDFSGYTDMAIGIALLFNIKLPINFNSPYKAVSIQDFWRRWHMTLSRFLRDYIYIPLGGNKKGNVSTYSNLFITFLIGGMWHGAGWTFIFWGALHGGALIIHRFWLKMNVSMNIFIAWFLTFNFVNITWVFFRAREWDDAIKVLNGMFSEELMLPEKFSGTLANLSDFGITFGDWLQGSHGVIYTPLWILLAFIIISCANSNEMAKKFKPSKASLLLNLVLLIVSFSLINNASEFLYFNF
ncbi:MAG TPA: membrane-bound O-acyltransferase family protein [Colwellia sp.]|nr:membrane-bound O-acyltransferase family protein [Colwellia sp.]